MKLSHEKSYEIRREWLKDPNEPSWSDDLPKFSILYLSNHDKEIRFSSNDENSFNLTDEQLLKKYQRRLVVRQASRLYDFVRTSKRQSQ